MKLRSLTSELQQKAKDELNENEDRLHNDLDHIKGWLEKQPHLKARTDDQLLANFMRGCKFSLEKTKRKLDYFYAMRTLVPEFFANKDPLLPEIQEILKAGIIVPLPKINGTLGPRIILIYYRNANADSMTLQNIFKVFFMVYDILMLEDDDSVVSGVSAWADIYNIPTSIMMQFTPSSVKKLLLSMQDGYPMRIKQSYFTNVSTAFEAIVNLMKSVLKEKIASRILVFNSKNFEKMSDVVPKELQPNDFGGNCGYVKDLAADWKKKVESYRDWFMEDDKYGTDESKRVGTPKTSADFLGIDGSFRKLTID